MLAEKNRDMLKTILPSLPRALITVVITIHVENIRTSYFLAYSSCVLNDLRKLIIFLSPYQSASIRPIRASPLSENNER